MLNHGCNEPLPWLAGSFFLCDNNSAAPVQALADDEAQETQEMQSSDFSGLDDNSLRKKLFRYRIIAVLLLLAGLFLVVAVPVQVTRDMPGGIAWAVLLFVALVMNLVSGVVWLQRSRQIDELLRERGGSHKLDE